MVTIKKQMPTKTPATIQLPSHFNRVKLCDGQTEHTLDEELPQITNDYWVEQVIEIPDTTTRYEVVSASDVGERSLAEVLILRSSNQAIALNGFDPGDDGESSSGNPSYDPFSFALEQITTEYEPEISYYISDHLGNTRIVYHTLFEDCTPTGIQYQLEHVPDYYPYGKILREYVRVIPKSFQPPSTSATWKPTSTTAVLDTTIRIMGVF